MIPLQNAVLTQSEPLTDEDVVARIQAGDAALFEILMRRYNQRVYRAVRAVLGGDQDVEDVMQQAYLNAYAHLDQFEGRAQFSTWLTRIAVNEALARRGKRASRFGEQEDTMLELIESNAPDPEQQAVTAEMREVMQREVAALPERFRVVVMLRDVEGLNTAETAACLDISEDLVKTRLHRARAILRANLYKRAGVTLESLFAFGNERCDRVVTSVMARLGRV
jgi:RNA polymerase sigma-70 factor, ECF subfamily